MHAKFWYTNPIFFNINYSLISWPSHSIWPQTFTNSLRFHVSGGINSSNPQKEPLQSTQWHQKVVLHAGLCKQVSKNWWKTYWFAVFMFNFIYRPDEIIW